VSGLLVVALTAAAGWASRWPTWRALLPLLALGLALASLPRLLQAVGRGRKPRQVFLIVAAFSHKHWVAQLIQDLHENLDRRGYDLVLKIPDRDYSGTGQVRLLDGILRRRREYAAGFIMVNDGEAIHPDLARFCDKAGMPVVFVDAEPFEAEEDPAPCRPGPEWRPIFAARAELDAADRRLHAVFCTNDEMALGATDALLFAGIPWTDTVVAGVDGTPDARALIEAAPSPLRATVVQDSYKVAEAATALMERMLRNEPVPKRTSVPTEILTSD
jgi:ABC-type sugar transport system substrate-binding protein